MMNTKVRVYSGIARETIAKITSSTEEWTSFLKTMSRNYEFTYPEQIMIYAQRPGAIFCKPYDEWNKEPYWRYVRRGSTGIALFVANGNKPNLRYVFDIADTGVSHSSPALKPWKVTHENRAYVSAAMERTFEVTGEQLESQLEEIARSLSTDYWEGYKEQLLGIVANSALEGYDEINIKAAFKKTVATSVAYTMYCRQTDDPDSYFEQENFRDVLDFNSRQATNALGTAVSIISAQMFQEIERAIKEYEQSRITERRVDYEQNDLPTDRRLSDPEHAVTDRNRGSEAAGQVRQNAEELSGAEQSHAPERHDSDRNTVPAPVGNRENSESQDRVAGEAVSGRESGTGQSYESDGLGTAHEQLESAGGGSGDDGAYQQLSLFPTEEQQIEEIKRAESQVPSAFSFAQEEIDIMLRSGINEKKGREIVSLAYRKQKPLEKLVETLKEVYHGGYGLKGSDGNISVWYGGKKVYFARGNAAREQSRAMVLSWEAVAERIGELLEQGAYATNVELTEAPGYERERLSQSLGFLCRNLSDKAREAELLSGLTVGSGYGTDFEGDTEKLAENMKDPVFLTQMKEEYGTFLKAYEADPAVLRFHYHNVKKLGEQIQGLDLPLKEYPMAMTEMSKTEAFITDDEIDVDLSRGSGFAGGKGRIYTYWKEEHSAQEKADFLKREYGIGGHSHACSGADSSMQDHDGKGITYQKGDCDNVYLSWTQVAKRIDRLMDKGWYLTKAEQEEQRRIEEARTEPEEVPVENEFLEKETEPVEAVAPEVMETEPVPELPAGNYHITDDHLGEGGPKEKFGRNISAITLLFQLEAENRNATKEEQEILAQYVGWGGLADAFDEGKENWAEEYQTLKALLPKEEYKAARSSTLNAHYTSPMIIRAIYDTVEQMGFESGNILEPAMGVGNFFGVLPPSMQRSHLYGVELDPISGRIAQKLYPHADITVAGFETTDRRDFYDLAVGNVPFGNYKVLDKHYNKLGFSIHNYFFAKTLDQVRPGGIVAYVTSRFTMDSRNSDARRYMAQRAELLGAIRLPNDAFKKNAGTEVVSDILFLQKREYPVDMVPEWVDITMAEDGYTINSYFAEHPEMVLGNIVMESTPYGKEELTVQPRADVSLSELLREAISHIRGTYQPAEQQKGKNEEKAEDVLPADGTVKNYSYTVADGEIYFRENSIMRHVTLNEKAKERVKGMVELRAIVNDLITFQLEDYPDEDISRKQKELDAAYDSFIEKNGLINSRANSQVFSEDSSYYLLCSLENLDEDGKLESKADMFTRRTIKPERKITGADTPSEALAISIGERGKVDLPYMAELLGNPDDYDRITEELNGVIFRDPMASGGMEEGWQTADEYLSGEVKSKLRVARIMAKSNIRYESNVQALEKAQPKDLEASEIDVRLGATWIEPEYIQEFMLDTFAPPAYQRHYLEVKFSDITSEWRIERKNIISDQDVAARVTYGTFRVSAYKILEETLNLKDIRVYDTVEDADGKERRVLNKKETTLAQQKQQAIKDAFQDWIWKAPQRREVLVTKYNELFNSTRPREYDGSHIRFGGMNPDITLREHQRNAIAHVLYGGNTLLAHEVGAGKTFEMTAAAMESKRLGLCQKSLFVVPNHLTEQWAAEFLRLYPSVKLLVARKKDFETANRKKFCARIATGDYDAVIIGHSQFERIPLSPERQERQLQEQIDDITVAVEELKYQRGENFTVKQMEKMRKTLEVRMEKLRAVERKDDVITFEQLGVDRLFVDESHGFKNLFLYTKMRNVAGLSTSEAQKSSDMFMKCRYMDEITGSRGVVFASGTPVSNSMTELYTVMRYLQYDTLQKKNLSHFDSWASTFGETTTAIEFAQVL